MLLTYSITKAKRALCNAAQFFAVHSILTTVMTRIVVDKSTDHAKPHSICFYHSIKDNKINICLENTDSDLKVHALHYANELLVRVRLILLKTFTNSLNMQKQLEKNFWETSNDTYSLSVRVQTMINHISICFLPQYQRQRKCFTSDHELKKALRDTLTRAAWYGL